MAERRKSRWEQSTETVSREEAVEGFKRAYKNGLAIINDALAKSTEKKNARNQSIEEMRLKMKLKPSKTFGEKKKAPQLKPLIHSELYHHGIKGQKWGIRRYQNEDGSLTDEGKKRYYGTAGDFKKDDYLEETQKRAEKEVTNENLGIAAPARTAAVGTAMAGIIGKAMIAGGTTAKNAAIAANAISAGVKSTASMLGTKAAGIGATNIASMAAAGAKAAPLVNVGKAALGGMLGAGAYAAIPAIVAGVAIDATIVGIVNHFASKEKGFNNYEDQVIEKTAEYAHKTGEWESKETARKSAREHAYYKKKLNQASSGNYGDYGNSGRARGYMPNYYW